MEYTNKQIKRILSIKEFVETVNVLSRIYVDFENKELTRETLADKQRIYKVFCSAMYNLIVAIKNSKDIFGKTKKYDEFATIINRKYVANDNKYFSKDNYESNLFKIIETIRHQNNHYQRDDEDDTVLFEIYIEFKELEELRIIINDIFDEIYIIINQEKIKKIVLEKPKIKYSIDKMTSKIDFLEQKFNESTNEIDKIFATETARAVELLREYLSPENIYDLLNNNQMAIEKVDSIDSEMIGMFEKVCNYMLEYGNEYEKESIKLVKEFLENNKLVNRSGYINNLKELVTSLKELKEKLNDNIN